MVTGALGTLWGLHKASRGSQQTGHGCPSNPLGKRHALCGTGPAPAFPSVPPALPGTTLLQGPCLGHPAACCTLGCLSGSQWERGRRHGTRAAWVLISIHSGSSRPCFAGAALQANAAITPQTAGLLRSRQEQVLHRNSLISSCRTCFPNQ